MSLPLKAKILLSKARIREWYDNWDGNVYVSFSGGKDSLVLLHLVRSLYPDVPGVFLNTSLEFPELTKFVRTFDNIEWIQPEISFKEVIEKYGIPFPSKEQSQYINAYIHAKSEKNKHKRWYGKDNKRKTGKIAEKWKFLAVDFPYEVSDKCCHHMQKKPIIKYEKATGNKGYVGLLAEESASRMQDYRLHGCNSYETKRKMSRPIAFWTEDNVWEYIKDNNLPYCNIYDMGYKRTGCLFCLFGIDRQKCPNKLQLLKETHPKHYKYCMETLRLREFLEEVNKHMDKPIIYE